jgi:hypothetical protein
MKCYCPYFETNLEESHSSISKRVTADKRKRKDESNLNCKVKHRLEDDVCSWKGRVDQLENHLKTCVSRPIACSFPSCEFIGSTRLLEVHYTTNTSAHMTLLVKENQFIKSKMKKMEE